MLDSPERVGRTSADHKGPAVEIFLTDQVFLCQRIVRLGDQVDMTRIEAMYRDARDLPRLLLQGEKNIHFFS